MFIPKNLEFHHTPLTLTDIQRKNLVKLADYLYNLPVDYEHFSMRDYFAQKVATDYYPFRSVRLEENAFVEKISHCGTVACAIGHGPLAGVKPLKTETDWSDYADRAFGYSDLNEGEFFFSTTWAHIDNTSRGAALRIYYALEHGFPQDACWGDDRREIMEYLSEYSPKELVARDS